MEDKLKRLGEIFLVSLKLGISSFGGPSAHIGYFRNEYVVKRKWLSDDQFADLLGIGQILPGPASSQVGIGIGIVRGGMLGGIASFLGFTLPSVMLLIGFALFFEDVIIEDLSWLHGFKLVAVAIVAQAVLGMWQQLVLDRFQKIVVLFSATAMLLFSSNLIQIVLISFSGCMSYWFYKNKDVFKYQKVQSYHLSKKIGWLSLIIFLSLLLFLPFLTLNLGNPMLEMFDKFFRSGALVFGGGHVVLPLLENEFVAQGLISQDQFLAGYSLTQGMPGPLFTFAAYIGTIIRGPLGGVVAIIAIFLPSFLLIIGVLPFWSRIRNSKVIQSSLPGINASVVGLLLATLYHPVSTSAVVNILDVFAVIGLFILLYRFKLSPLLIVVMGGILGFLLP